MGTALPPRGGPWKLGSGLGQNPEANTALGVGWGAPAVELFESRARRLALPALSLPPPLIPPKSACSTTPSSPGQDLEKVPSEEETETGGRVPEGDALDCGVASNVGEVRIWRP